MQKLSVLLGLIMVTLAFSSCEADIYPNSTDIKSYRSQLVPSGDPSIVCE